MVEKTTISIIYIGAAALRNYLEKTVQNLLSATAPVEIMLMHTFYILFIFSLNY